MTFFNRLHQYLPLGNLYLVVLGIVGETIAFYQLVINYITYASLMDILLSPISAMTDHPLVFGAVTAYLLFTFLYPWLLMKKAGNKMRGKILNDKKLNRDMNDDEKKNTVLIHFVHGSALGLLAFFLGFGWSTGQQTKKRCRIIHFNASTA